MNGDDAAPAVPTFDALMIPALKALEVMGGSASNLEHFQFTPVHIQRQ
jgi:hypothetical protein